MRHIANGGRAVGGEDGVLRAGRGFELRRRAELGIYREVEDVVEVGIILTVRTAAQPRAFRPALDGDRVGAGDEIAGGIGEHEFAPRIIAALVSALEVERRVRGRAGAESEARHFHAIEINDGGVVVHDAQEERGRRRARDGELAAEANALVVDGEVRGRLRGARGIDGHVRAGIGGGELRAERDAGLSGRGGGGVAVDLEETDGRGAVPPCGVLCEARGAPGIHRSRGLIGARAVAPAGSAARDVSRRRRTGGRRFPVTAEVVVERRIHQFERRAVAIRRHRPGRVVAVVHFIHARVGGVAQDNVLAIAAEAASPGTERRRAPERLHRRRIRRHHEIAAGRNRARRRGGEYKVHCAAEPPVAEVHGRAERIVQFDELRADAVVRRVVENLVDLHMQVRRADRERDHLFIALPRLVGDAQPNTDRLTQRAGEVASGDELIAGNGEVRVVGIARAGHEREGVRLFAAGISG